MALANEFCSKIVNEPGSTRCGDIMERQFGRRFDMIFYKKSQSPIEAICAIILLYIDFAVCLFFRPLAKNAIGWAL